MKVDTAGTGQGRARKVDIRLPGTGNSNSHGARPVHLIITMIRWIRTGRLSIKISRSREEGGQDRKTVRQRRHHLLCVLRFAFQFTTQLRVFGVRVQGPRQVISWGFSLRHICAVRQRRYDLLCVLGFGVWGLRFGIWCLGFWV